MSGTDADKNAAKNAERDRMEPGLYEIRIKGHLDRRWTDWFHGLSITHTKEGETLLRGAIIDQSALHGLLRKIGDLGMPLISVMPIPPGATDSSEQTA